MTLAAANSLLQAQSHFRGLALPEPGHLAGYAALALAFDIEAGMPSRLSVIGKRHKKFASEGWQYYTPRHRPAPTLAGHLTFALRYEGVALPFLLALFETIDPRAIENIVKAAPTGRYARRIWLLFEWLTGQRLDLPNAPQGVYTETIDPDIQLTLQGPTSRRYRLRENWPGSRAICPMVWWTGTGLPPADLALAKFRDALSFLPFDAKQQVAHAVDIDECAAARALGGAAVRSRNDEHGTVESLLDELFQYQTSPERAEFEAFAQRIYAGCQPALAACLIGFAFAARHAELDTNGGGHLRLIRLLAGFDKDSGFPIPLLSAIGARPSEYQNLLVSVRMRTRREGVTSFDATPHAEFLARTYHDAIAIDLKRRVEMAADYLSASVGFHP